MKDYLEYGRRILYAFGVIKTVSGIALIIVGIIFADLFVVLYGIVSFIAYGYLVKRMNR